MPETITSLIEKLEGAAAGSRELDCAICDALIPPDMRPRVVGHGQYDADAHVRTQSVNAGPSRSLDAALALAERVLTLGAWDVGYYYNSDRPQYARLVIVRDDEGQPEIYGRSATPALALCAALLRAQSKARATGEDSPANSQNQDPRA